MEIVRSSTHPLHAPAKTIPGSYPPSHISSIPCHDGIVSTNGKSRKMYFTGRLLNVHVFLDGRHAQDVVEAWRNEYNQKRLGSSLNYMTPAEFAEHCRDSGRPAVSLRSGNPEAAGTEQRIETNPLSLSDAQTGGRALSLTVVTCMRFWFNCRRVQEASPPQGGTPPCREHESRNGEVGRGEL